MATIKKYNGSTWENAVVRKYGTASEIITPPTTIYADGTAISTYTIKGNTVQDGTPTPSNPVDVSGVGELTDNLFNVNDSSSMSTAGCTATVSNNTLSQVNTGAYSRTVWEFEGLVVNDKYNVSLQYSNPNQCSVQIRVMDSDNSTIIAATAAETNTSGTFTLTFTARNTTQYIRIYSNTLNAASNETVTFTQIMLVKGDTAPTSYIPWGYKIPISSVQTVNNYLGSVQTTRQIRKLVLTGDETLSYQVQPPLFIINIPTNHFIPRVTALCTEYIYNSAQSSILANSQHGDFGLQYVNVRDEYNVWFNNSTYATNDEFKAYLAQQYANGTPVTVWYVLATEETAAVNEPLMKIGTYADTLSNAAAIPTIEGANAISIDTTVQPSEFTATWTGWHDSSVKEYDGTNWQ